MIPAYPLQWPASRERIKTPGVTRYAITLVTAYSYATKQLLLLGASKIVISSNAILKKNGSPSIKQPKVADAGAAVWFQLTGDPLVWYSISCDTYDSVAGNLRAIGLSVVDIRKVTQRVNTPLIQTFAATPPNLSQQQKRTPPRQDPPPRQDNGYPKPPAWCTILSVNANATWSEAKRAYYRLAKIYHPDLGGNSTQFQELNTAYLEAKIYYGVY